MKQSTYIAAAIAIAFVIYIVTKGSAATYLGLLTGSIGSTPLADTTVDLNKSADGKSSAFDGKTQDESSASSGAGGGGGGGGGDAGNNAQSGNTDKSSDTTQSGATDLPSNIVGNVLQGAFGAVGNSIGFANDLVNGDIGHIANTGIGMAVGAVTGGGFIGQAVSSGFVSGILDSVFGKK